MNIIPEDIAAASPAADEAGEGGRVASREAQDRTSWPNQLVAVEGRRSICASIILPMSRPTVGGAIRTATAQIDPEVDLLEIAEGMFDAVSDTVSAEAEPAAQRAAEGVEQAGARQRRASGSRGPKGG